MEGKGCHPIYHSFFSFGGAHLVIYSYLQFITPLTTAFGPPYKIFNKNKNMMKTLDPLEIHLISQGGPPKCIQWASLQDTIKRFGGSTAPTAPWPRSEMAEEAEPLGFFGGRAWKELTKLYCTWYPKQPVLSGWKWNEMEISNHFSMVKILVHHRFETFLKWMFQVPGRNHWYDLG